MTRVLTLGTIVAIACGVLLGLTLAYGQWMLSIGALILGVGGAAVVALAAPEPAPTVAPVIILGGPVVRPVVELDAELDAEADVAAYVASDAEPAAGLEPDAAPEIPAPTPALVPLEPDRPVKSAA